MADSTEPAQTPPPFVLSLTRRRLGVPAWVWLALFISCGVFSLLRPPSPRYRFGNGLEMQGSAFQIITLADGTEHYAEFNASRPADAQSEVFVQVTLRRSSGRPHPVWGRFGFCEPVMYYEAEVVSLPMRGSGPKLIKGFEAPYAPFAAVWTDRHCPTWNAGPSLRAGNSTWSAPWPEGELFNRQRILTGLERLLCLILVGITFAALVVPRRDERRSYCLSIGVCPKCRYALHGLESARCPECGEPLDT